MVLLRAACLVLLAAVPLVPAPARADAAADVAEGKAAMDRYDYAAAAAAFTRAIDAGTLDDADTADALAWRGEAYRMVGDTDAALPDLDRAIALAPDWAFAYGTRGAAHQMAGDLDASLADLNRAIQIDANYTFAYALRGETRRQQGSLEGALSDLGYATTLDPSYGWAFAQRGQVHRERGDTERALADFEHALELDPSLDWVRFWRGFMRYLADDLQGAAADFRFAAEADPADAYSAIWVALAAARLGADPGRELAGRLAPLDLTVWPGPIVRLLRGDLDAGALYRLVDAESAAGRRCEADFYVGLLALRDGARSVALPALRRAAATCPASYLEGDAARAELARIGG